MQVENFGTPVPKKELEGLFPHPEGEANFYYGRIRSGKTYGATYDALENARQGYVVYITWPIRSADFDERSSFFHVLASLIFPWRKRFFKFPCSENFHFINAETGEVDGKLTFNPDRPSAYIEYLNTLNHCILYIDEAWRVLDSYQGSNMSIGGRNLVLVTGHKFRTVNLIAQRPTSVHVSARGNMNRFYKFVRLWKFGSFVRFARYEFQDMVGETVDETAEPISVKKYWGKKSVFDAYDTHFYGGQAPLHTSFFSAFDVRYFDRFRLFFLFFRKVYGKFSRKKDNSV